MVAYCCLVVINYAAHVKLWPIPYWLLIDVTVAGYCLVVINSAGPWCLTYDAFNGLFRSLCLFGLVPQML